MLRILSFVCFAWLAFAPSIQAAEFGVAGLAIDVPARFEGPVSTEIDGSSKTSAFTVPSAGLSPATVLQITAVDLGGALSQRDDAELAEISQRYLLQMLQGIERRRTEYRRSEPKSIRLGSVPAAEVAWTGKANGLETNGKMFCVVSESGLVFFHVMGGGGSPNVDMAAAIKAIEQLRRPVTKTH